ncbi:hypothetical protein GEMRC1_004597 [Eukaryota sp. GEM-RC1]
MLFILDFLLSVLIATIIAFVSISCILIYKRYSLSFTHFTGLRILLAFVSFVFSLVSLFHLSLINDRLMSLGSSTQSRLCFVSHLGFSCLHFFVMFSVLYLLIQSRKSFLSAVFIPSSSHALKTPVLLSLVWLIFFTSLFFNTIDLPPPDFLSDHLFGSCKSTHFYLNVAFCFISLLSLGTYIVLVTGMCKQILNKLIISRVKKLICIPFCFFLSSILRLIHALDLLPYPSTSLYILRMTLVSIELVAYIFVLSILCVSPYIDLALPESTSPLADSQEKEMKHVRFLTDADWEKAENPQLSDLLGV